ncbi:MAG: hypothetical protein LBS16_04730 [Prevotellaceae bacterium]|jgi:hypothetical protein|nr:hypothetical protein [Prevotellaceae bacterium]
MIYLRSKKPLLLIAGILWSAVGTLQAQQTTVMPSSFVGGNASVAYEKAWIPFHNPAALAAQTSAGVQLLYDNRYITRELSNKAMNVWFPTKYFHIGGSFTHFGFAEYQEMLLAATVARQLGERFRLGIEVDYYTVYLSPTERYAGTLTAHAGCQVKVSETVSIGFSVFNPVFSKIEAGATDKLLPVRFSLGTRWQIRGKVDWLLQVDKEVRSSVRWATGFEYVMLDFLTVRLGAYGQQSFVPTLGAGVTVSKISFDLQADYSGTLGVSLLGALRYSF